MGYRVRRPVLRLSSSSRPNQPLPPINLRRAPPPPPAATAAAAAEEEEGRKWWDHDSFCPHWLISHGKLHRSRSHASEKKNQGFWRIFFGAMGLGCMWSLIQYIHIGYLLMRMYRYADTNRIVDFLLLFAWMYFTCFLARLVSLPF